MNGIPYSDVRFFRVVSHNGNSNSIKGPAGASNFNVVLGDEMAKVGNVVACSLENITFPNVFPNISPTNHGNDMIVRFTSPSSDGFTLTLGDVYTFTTSDGIEHTYTVDEPFPGVNSTVDWVELLNEYFELEPYMSFTTDVFGAIYITSKTGPLSFTSSNWRTVFGVRTSGLSAYATYPPSVCHVITLPVGFYDQDQIATMLQTGLNAASGGGFTVTVVAIGYDKRFQIDSVDTPFCLVPVASPSGSPVNYRQLVYQLGFQHLPPASALYLTIQALLNPSLQGEQVVYLHSVFLSSSSKSFSGEGPQDSVIATIPVWAGYGELVEYSLNQWSTPAIFYVSPITPREFDFTLRNQYNEILDIGWNQTLSVTLRLFFQPK